MIIHLFISAIHIFILGKYQHGPASVEAVKRGDLAQLFDTPWSFSEANADMFYYTEHKEGLRQYKTDTAQ